MKELMNYGKWNFLRIHASQYVIASLKNLILKHTSLLFHRDLLNAVMATALHIFIGIWMLPLLPAMATPLHCMLPQPLPAQSIPASRTTGQRLPHCIKNHPHWNHQVRGWLRDKSNHPYSLLINNTKSPQTIPWQHFHPTIDDIWCRHSAKCQSQTMQPNNNCQMALPKYHQPPNESANQHHLMTWPSSTAHDATKMHCTNDAAKLNCQTNAQWQWPNGKAKRDHQTTQPSGSAKQIAKKRHHPMPAPSSTA